MNYLKSTTSGYSIHYYVLLLIILFSHLTYGQKNFQLHPSVGNTIEFNEKLDYSLFTQSANGGFEFATIQYIDTNFVHIETRIFSEGVRPVINSKDTIIFAQAVILQEQKKIEKINVYYFNIAKQPKAKKKLEAPKKKIPVRFPESSVEKRMIERMRFCTFDESEYRSSLEYGLRPTEIQLEINQ